MDQSMKGTTALVIGGSGVLGSAIADAFDEAGATVISADLHSREHGENTQRRFVPVDITSAVSTAQAIDSVVDAEGRIDVLVNCAGIEESVGVEDMPVAAWQAMIDVHLTGTFLACQQAYAHMRSQGSGKIINVSSQLAYKGSANLAHYCAAKAGILGFTRAFAREAIRYNVNVNAIAPGPVDSPVLRACGEEFISAKLSEMPIARLGLPEEITGTAVLLASKGGDFYVGQTLCPCGGDVMI